MQREMPKVATCIPSSPKISVQRSAYRIVRSDLVEGLSHKQLYRSLTSNDAINLDAIIVNSLFLAIIVNPPGARGIDGRAPAAWLGKAVVLGLQ